MGSRRRSRHLAPLAVALALLGPAAWAETPAPATAGRETVRLPAGTALHQVASPVALVLARTGDEAELPVLDRSGVWVRVALGEQSGWVDLSAVTGGDAAGGDAAGGDAAPGPLLPLADDAATELLAAASEALATPVHRLAWGRFGVLTDRPDHPLIALGARLADSLPALHASRYGLDGGSAPGAPATGPVQPPSLGTVVLFAHDAGYRAFLAATVGDAAAGDLSGHAGGGVAALPLGDRTTRQAAATLVHELAHLLNRRAFAADPPTWLDEGLAGDLELVEIGTGGELLEERWAEGPTGYRGRRGRLGPLVALDRLIADAARGRLETLPQLAALERAALAASPRRAELYALAALWVRYLLDDPRRAAGFRRFLDALAGATGPAPADGGAALLAEALATDLAALERTFRLWLRDLARRT